MIREKPPPTSRYLGRGGLPILQLPAERPGLGVGRLAPGRVDGCGGVCLVRRGGVRGRGGQAVRGGRGAGEVALFGWAYDLLKDIQATVVGQVHWATNQATQAPWH